MALTDKEQLITDLTNIALRSGPCDQQPENGKILREYTLEEIGKELGVTRERVRQIEAKAIKKLQHLSRRKVLQPFSDD